MPAWLSSVTERITKETNLFPAPINHVLVNEYLPGQGITVCVCASEPPKMLPQWLAI